MGPKRLDNASRAHRQAPSTAAASSTIGAGTAGELENQQCVGKFAADMELCCRDPSSPYPVLIPVYIRGHPPVSSQYQASLPPNPLAQAQYSGTHSGTPVTPSIGAGNADEQSSSMGKKTSRARIPSAGQSLTLGGLTGIDYDSRSYSVAGQEQSKVSSSGYKTFHLLKDSDFFRPKLLVDSIHSENDPIDQITALYMRGWQLDQHFIDMLKRIVLLQEQLHTLNFCYVGLNEHTINGLIDLCQVTKNLKNVVLDGNPQAADYFHLLLDKEDSKITSLSLRFCNITDSSAKRLAHSLGNISKQNWKLLTLILSSNQIGDQGALALATALRYNRSLVCLNLSSNFITDQGASSLALVLRRIVLTPAEIVQRRFLLARRYAELHPEDARNYVSSPTPSNMSTKSKSGYETRADWKRLTDPSKRKTNPVKIAQLVVDKRGRAESDEIRPPSANKPESKRGRNDGSGGRSSTLNPSRKTPTNATPSANTKETDPARATVPARTKKLAVAATTASKKNISIVKEENEENNAEARAADMSLSGKGAGLHVHQIDRENPLLEIGEVETHDGEVWLKGNFALLSLNLSRNQLTMDSVKEFLLSVQQQSALTRFNDAFASTTTLASLIDFSGLCRLDLKGMNEISVKSAEYQSLETLLIQKSPVTRLQQYREREAKELLDLQTQATAQPAQTTIAEKTITVPDKARAGSSLKGANQRPTSRLKD